MSDDFKTSFVVDLAPEAVWEALHGRTLPGESPDAVHYVLPGFPSLVPVDPPGARCTPVEVDEGRLLRVRKDHHPCQDSEIAIALEQEGTGTRITVVQSGFGAFLDIVGRDTVFGHGQQIVRDLRLYLERGITVPGTAWGVLLGAVPRATAVGLEIARVDAGGFAESAGLVADDLLLTLRGIRLHDIQQLQTVLALTEPGTTAAVTWARGRQVYAAEAVFAT